MSRPITPVAGSTDHATGVAGPALTGNSRASSYIAPGTAGVDHAAQAPEYLPSDDAEQTQRPDLQRSNSQMSQSATYIPSRGGTLKKKASLHKTGSVKRSGSRKSSYAGSVRSMRLGEKEKYEPAEYNSAFYCPVPTASSPTEILANRFHAWRRVLKDLINYFRDLHKSYETRSKTLLSASNVINNTSMPVDFLSSGGIGDAAEILSDFHKQAITEANKARDLENEVIMQLTGLRSDLSQKIKEIKGLSGDFKNSVHKEQDSTRKAVNAFQEALGMVDRDAAAAAGKGDPFLMKLGVERQLERQIEEENYLHRAYLNLEASGRELESIVVGEIQKAYNVLAGILKRDADGSYEAAEKLREGPLAMARDHEWDAFTTDNVNMVDPRQPLRQVQNISYEGKNHPAAIEVKSGMLERKSKYLKNYTPGWYILSPTHLHEFKSADQIPFQAPVMSLYLPEQKLGSHSEPGSSSHKFMLKGRQTGSMHRGHTWIFRAETHDTMMAWFSDIKELTEKRGEARNEFVRRTHARSASGSSQRAPSIASGDSQLEEDEADKTAFAGEQSVRGLQPDQSQDGSIYGASGANTGLVGDEARSEAGWRPPQRPQPGGRFPSDVNVTRGLQAPLSPSSGDSGDEHDRETIAAATALPGSAVPFAAATTTGQQHDEYPNYQTQENIPAVTTGGSNVTGTGFTTGEYSTVAADSAGATGTGYTSGEHSRVMANPTGAEVAPDTQSQYHEWVDTVGAGVAGAGAGAFGATAAQRYIGQERSQKDTPALETAASSQGQSSPPIAAIPVASDVNATHGVGEAPPLTASAYQTTTMPTATPVISSAAREVEAQPSLVNGSLIGGTDIRAASEGGVPRSLTGVPETAIPTSATILGGTDIRVPGGSSVTYSSTTFHPTAPTGAGLQYTTTKGDPTPAAGSTSRPSPVHTKSVQTISDLHIPGEYPKSANA